MNQALVVETIAYVVDEFVGNNRPVSASNIAWHVCRTLGCDFGEVGEEIEQIVESYPDFTIALNLQEQTDEFSFVDYPFDDIPFDDATF